MPLTIIGEIVFCFFSGGGSKNNKCNCLCAVQPNIGVDSAGSSEVPGMQLSDGLSLTTPAKEELQRSVVRLFARRGSRMCSHSRDDPRHSLFGDASGRIGPSDGEVVVFLLLLSYLTFPMERSPPTENNKVRKA